MDFAAATHDVQGALLGEFGEAITFLPAGKSPITTTPEGGPLLGIFEDPHRAVDLSTGSVVSTQEVTLDVRLSDLLPTVPRPNLDFVVVRGKKWTFNDVRPDGEGMATLVLTSPQPYG